MVLFVKKQFFVGYFVISLNLKGSFVVIPNFFTSSCETHCTIWVNLTSFYCRYPYNNFLHHHVEHIVMSCLGSKNLQLVDHLLCECNLIEKIVEAEKNFTLASDVSKVMYLCTFIIRTVRCLGYAWFGIRKPD